MNVLIACEFSGTVRDAFRKRGHNAWSCDLLPTTTDNSSNHTQGDVFDFLSKHLSYFDLIIAHPDCTYLTNSGVWLLSDNIKRNVKDGVLTGEKRRIAREESLDFVRRLMGLDCDKVVIENPSGAIGSNIRKADQYIHPHQFGHDASKKTGLWLKGVCPLVPTKDIALRIVVFNGKEHKRWGNQTDSGQNRLAPSEDRWKKRAKTYQGIAEAMAEQWGAG